MESTHTTFNSSQVSAEAIKAAIKKANEMFAQISPSIVRVYVPSDAAKNKLLGEMDRAHKADIFNQTAPNVPVEVNSILPWWLAMAYMSNGDLYMIDLPPKPDPLECPKDDAP